MRVLIDPVTVEEMRQAVQGITHGWLDQSRNDPEWIAWVRQREALSFVVLTLCRMLYSLEMGSVASKPAAARWAQEGPGKRWEGLIRRSLEGQQDRGEVAAGEVEGMLALLAYAEEQSR